ncbi:MAG: UvrD-helicase domain-containing protein [Clostridia bacterium]|nr:UvrD-helicase domain-containing protein [Clostridia bacterium]
MSTLESRYLAAKRRLFDIVYDTLNEPQRQAVFCTQGPLLVLAGAGSGKTTVLVRRISFILRYGNAYFDESMPEGVDEAYVTTLEAAAQGYEEGDTRTPMLSREEIEEQLLPCFAVSPCPPWAILAITFTNKAAREIKERLAREIGNEDMSREITAGTFHSVCVRFLRQWGELVGYRPGFTIYDTDDKRRLVSDIMKEMNISDKVLPPKTVCNAISAAKDNLVTPENFVLGRSPRDKDILRIYEAYQKRLMEYNALDFDDIIMKTVELLENHEDALRYYTKKYRYVCVDEYQDTNPAQFRLTELLSSGYRNIMVVGDDDQSIYRFRGATVENILSFDKVYADCRVVKLEQNYRSTKHILDAANAVISHNSDRHPKRLWCEAGEGAPISLKRCEDQNAEAKYIIDKITTLAAQGKRTYRDFAILYRINEMARALESAFAKSGIPYRVLGGQRFYDRKEIRDMIAYLYVILNPSDDQRLKRIVNEPKRGIGATSLEAVEQIARDLGISMFAVMETADKYVALSRVAPKLTAFATQMREIASEGLSPSALLEALFVRTGYKQMLVAEGEVSRPRIDAVEEFVTAAKDYEEREEEPTLFGFMEEVALVADVDKYDAEADAVTLMTIHSAKGLEFPVVFLPGMEEGIFPSGQCFESPQELSEERRLAYVALTRAKEEVYISHTNQRMLYGRTAANALSRFVNREIPKGLIKEEPYSAGQRRPTMGGFGAESRPRTYGGQGGNRPAWEEMHRAPSVSQKPARTASSFGVERYEIGTRVVHPAFGGGVVTGSKDMGGDVLYVVRFDTVGEKKLMATYAKLKRE